MLSDEEKKAIKVVNKRTERLIEELKIEEEDLIDEPKIAYLITQIEANKTLANLIEKQQKEIEELTNEVMEKELIIDGMKEDRRIAVEEIQEQYFVSKEESEQKERKAYIDGTNVADKLCNKKWEDKIKAKIEELEEAYEDNYIINILQSLLEKE